MATKTDRGAEGPPPKRPRGTRPSLPDEIGGLVAALRESHGKDDGPLRCWVEEKQPLLEGALRAWGRNPVDARLLAHGLVVEEFFAIASGAGIEREVPWMSGTIAHLWQKMCTARQKEMEKARLEDLPDPAPSPLQEAQRTEQVHCLRARILQAARLLPAPYSHVLIWQGIFGLSHEEIRKKLCRVRHVGRDQVAYHIREAHGMYRSCEEGRDPRAHWLQRYDPRKNPWIVTPLPPLPGQIP